jgi:signal peptidase I
MMRETTKNENSLYEFVKTIVVALLLAGFFRSLFFQPFWIPSGSMKQTLMIGDFIFVNKMAYGYSYASCPSIPFTSITSDKLCGFIKGDNTRIFGGSPERGDVVVFRHPVTGADYIKRLVGLPGDKLQMKDGNLILNGVLLETQNDGVFREKMEPQGSLGRRPRCSNGAVGNGGICEKERSIETLPSGQSYATLNIINGARGDNTSIFSVPDGHYFFMGDNRDNSTDSRFPQVFDRSRQTGVGFVKYENIVGRADRIMFSSAGRSMFYFWTWRSDRFFEAVE